MDAIQTSQHIEQCLSQLFDDDEFDELNTRLATFNIFDAIGGVRAELRHSNFLAFLFSPNRSHELGPIILQKFLRSVLDDTPPERRSIRPLELATSDIDDAIVHRERDNIDILIEIKSIKCVIVIENKVGSKAYPGQLEKYKSYTKNKYSGWNYIFVFLTPNGDDPECDDYTAFSYRKIADLIEDITRRNQLSPDQNLVLMHYVEMLRRHIVPNDELRALALRLYDRHREAFDFIFEVRPQPQSILEIIKPKIFESGDLIEDRSIQSIIRFLPGTWDAKMGSIRCKDAVWTTTGRGLLFEIKVNTATGRVTVALIVGPIDRNLRSQIYRMASNNGSIFKGISKPMGKLYSTIFSRELLSSALANRLDFEQQCTHTTLAWSDFKETELPALLEAVEDIVADLLTKNWSGTGIAPTISSD